MASTYSALKIELITTGEQVGDWGNTTNANLGTALEEAIVGRVIVNFSSDANLTISLTNTNATQQARHYILNLTSTGALTATRNLVVPTIDKPYIIENNTTGGQSILVKTSGGTGITVPNGKTAAVYADSTNVVSAFNYIPSITTDSLTGTGLTPTRVPYATTDGLIIDSTNLTFTDTVFAGGASTVTRVNTTTLCTVTTTTASGLTTGGTVQALTGVVPGIYVVTVLTSTTFTFNTAATTALTAVVITFAASGVLASSGTLFTTLGVSGDGTFSGTGQVQMPSGNTAARSIAPNNGMFRYNSQLVAFEGYAGSRWSGVGGAQAGGVIFENSLVIDANYTLTANKNGLSVGPITIKNVVFAGGASTVTRVATTTLCTVTTTNDNGLITGDTVYAITGVVPGLYTVTVLTSKTFTFTTVETTALSAVAITFSGAVVTIPAGQRWVVL